MSSENDSPLSPSPPSPKITTPVVNKPRQIFPPPPTTTTTTTKDPPPPPPPKTSTTTSTSTTKEPLPPPPTTKEPLPPPPTTKSLPPPATTITSTLPIITPSIPATTTTPLTTASTSGTTTQSDITTDNTAAGVNGNEGNYGNGTSSNIIIPAIILATLVASAFIGYFVYRKVKVIKESRSSRSFFENLDNIGPNASGPEPLDKRRPSSVVFSRILNYNLSSNNNNNNNKKFNNSASPTRLITENNTSSEFRRNNNNEASRLIRTTSPIQTSQPRNNYHQNYQQRNLQQQQQQPNFYNQAPLPSSISPSGFIPPSSNFPPHPPPLYPLQYNNPQQQPSPPPALHVQNRFVNNNNSFTQQGSFNYAPVNDVNSYPTSGRLVRVPVQVNKQYNEPVNYTNDYNGYNNQHITTMNQGNFDDSGNFKNDIDDNGREIDNNMKKEEKLGSVLPTIITTAPSVEDDSVSL